MGTSHLHAGKVNYNEHYTCQTMKQDKIVQWGDKMTQLYNVNAKLQVQNIIDTHTSNAKALIFRIYPEADFIEEISKCCQ